MKTGPCRGCGATMVWAVTVNGKNQPFDPEPAEKGNRALISRGRGEPPLAVALTDLGDGLRLAAERHGIALYTPHHATCPERQRFTKGAADEPSPEGQ